MEYKQTGKETELTATVEEVNQDTQELEEQNITASVVGTGKAVRPYSFTTAAVAWGDALNLLTENYDAATRNSVMKELQANYSGTFEDTEEITITPTTKFATPVAAVLKELGFDIDLSTVAQPEKAASTPGAPRAKAAPKTGVCLYSGQPTSGGHFRPGYDMKMRGHLTRIVDNIDLAPDAVVPPPDGSVVEPLTVEQAIAKLVGFGWYTEDTLRARRRKVSEDREKKAAEAKARAEEAARLKAEKAAAAAATPTETPAEPAAVS